MIGSEHERMAPFGAFRFHVAFTEHPLPSGESLGDDASLCQGSFSECTGLEVNMEPKAIAEGGRNYGEAQRVGRVKFGTVTLKRGLTNNIDLWRWFELVNGFQASAYRLTATLSVYGPDVPSSNGAGAVLTASGSDPVVWRWQLLRCLPTKFKVPDFNATSKDIAIEELHLVHEGLHLLT